MDPSTSPAAEQAAHPNGGPGRRPHELTRILCDSRGFQKDDSHQLLSETPGTIQRGLVAYDGAVVS